MGGKGGKEKTTGDALHEQAKGKEEKKKKMYVEENHLCIMSTFFSPLLLLESVSCQLSRTTG